MIKKTTTTEQETITFRPELLRTTSIVREANDWAKERNMAVRRIDWDDNERVWKVIVEPRLEVES